MARAGLAEDGRAVSGEAMSEKYMTPKQVAERLGITERALQWLRTNGNGPKHHRLGYRTVRYTEADVVAWEDKRDQSNRDSNVAVDTAASRVNDAGMTSQRPYRFVMTMDHEVRRQLALLQAASVDSQGRMMTAADIVRALVMAARSGKVD